MKLKKLSYKWIVFNQLIIENQLKTKRVESYLVACLDEGSIPSDSTFALRSSELMKSEVGLFNFLYSHQNYLRASVDKSTSQIYSIFNLSEIKKTSNYGITLCCLHFKVY